MNSRYFALFIVVILAAVISDTYAAPVNQLIEPVFPPGKFIIDFGRLHITLFLLHTKVAIHQILRKNHLNFTIVVKSELFAIYCPSYLMWREILCVLLIVYHLWKASVAAIVTRRKFVHAANKLWDNSSYLSAPLTRQMDLLTFLLT